MKYIFLAVQCLLHQHPDVHVLLFLHPPHAVLVHVLCHPLHLHHLTKVVALALVLFPHPVPHAHASAQAATGVHKFLLHHHQAPHVIGLPLQAPTQAQHHPQHLQQA